MFFSFSSIAQQDSLALQMDWLVGKWITTDSLMIEEWQPFEKGFKGVGYLYQEGNGTAEEPTERLQLKYVDGVINYVAHPKQNSKPVFFKNLGINEYTYTFYSAENDFPKWIIYQRINIAFMRVIIKNDEKEQEFYFHKMTP
jgi:hypothetical protein